MKKKTILISLFQAIILFTSSFFVIRDTLYGEVIKHKAYTVNYNEEHEQANWVSYELTIDMLKKVTDRKNNFIEDPSVTTKSANSDDYKNTGYDRGHLCPSADMCWSNITMEESFFMSNISPQSPKLNRNAWKYLESDIRKWVIRDSILTIICAGVLIKDLPKIGIKNKVSVPKLFYKVILDNHGSVKKAVGFIFPNGYCSDDIWKYAVSVDSVESLTGFDFFAGVSPKIESTFNPKDWK
jgi:endonuclease G